MGYIVIPIAVDLDEVKNAIGSKDQALLATLKEVCASNLDQIDELLENALDEDAEPLSADDVLRHLIMGEPYREEAGFAYGYCFEILCQHFGDRLPNGEWSAMRSAWFDTVQAALETAGVSGKTFSVTTLVYRGPPVEMPEIDDFPGIGYLTKAEVKKFRDVLAAADLSKVENQEAVSSIEQIRSWLDECARSRRDLVCTFA